MGPSFQQSQMLRRLSREAGRAATVPSMPHELGVSSWKLKYFNQIQLLRLIILSAPKKGNLVGSIDRRSGRRAAEGGRRSTLLFQVTQGKLVSENPAVCSNGD